MWLRRSSYSSLVAFSTSATDAILNSKVLVTESLPDRSTITIMGFPKDARKFLHYQRMVELDEAGEKQKREPKPYGLKLHVAVANQNTLDNQQEINQNNTNIGQSWNIVRFIIDHYNIYLTKIIRQNKVEEGEGKQITIYAFFQLADRDWNLIVNQIEQELSFHRIIQDDFSEENDEQRINGARYVSYRYEQRASRRGLPLDQIPGVNPFRDIHIDQEVIVRENTRREQLMNGFFQLQGLIFLNLKP